MKIIAFLLVSIILCSQEMVNGLPASSMMDVAKVIQRSGNNNEALAQALIMQALAEDLSNEAKESIAIPRGRDRASIAQNSGPVTIEDCGNPGQIVNSVLQASLFWVPANTLKVTINCGISSGCTQVKVEVPTGTVQADIDVCVDKTTKQFCVEVFAGASCKPSWLAIPIPINIPIATSGTTAPITLMIDLLGSSPCVSVKLNNSFPKCSNN